MSTRCNILVRDEHQTIQLYRHCDGYPESVIPDLKEVLAYAWELPRFEADDFSAAMVRAWKREGGGGVYIDGDYVPSDTLHGDIEFLYVIDPPKGSGRNKNKPIVKAYHSEEDFVNDAHFWKGVVGSAYKPRR